MSPSSGEFNTGGRPTASSAEKLALITGVNDGSIQRISYSPKAKQYVVQYSSDKISKQRLATARERMCRYRRVTFDRVDRDEKLIILNAPPELLEQTKNMRTQYFYCR